jgi:hypothetical protein
MSFLKNCIINEDDDFIRFPNKIEIVVEITSFTGEYRTSYKNKFIKNTINKNQN